MWQFVGTVLLKPTGLLYDVYKFAASRLATDEADSAIIQLQHRIGDASATVVIDSTYRLVPVGDPPPGSLAKP